MFKIVLLVLGLLVVLGVGYALKMRTSSEVVQTLPEATRTTMVTATSNKFTPSSLEGTLFEDFDIEVTATDHDYIFKVTDYPRMEAVIKKGQPQRIPIRYLGVGEYSYTCGVGCSGLIVIHSQVDDDED